MGGSLRAVAAMQRGARKVAVHQRGRQQQGNDEQPRPGAPPDISLPQGRDLHGTTMEAAPVAVKSSRGGKLVLLFARSAMDGVVFRVGLHPSAGGDAIGHRE